MEPVSQVDSTHQFALDAGEVSLWPDSEVPGGFANLDYGSIELGVKFRTSEPGSILGIRFYKGQGNTGTHVGNLWTASGTRLATVTFTNETATGWQTARFSQPVAVQPNTVYVASYFAPAGRYAGVGTYFLAGRGAGPLYALRDGEQGGNGVYTRASSSAFPTSTYNANNYFVDVVFRPDGAAPGNGNGLLGEYFDNMDFTGTKVSRTDATVSFNWSDSPAPGISGDTFSARWTGQVLAPVSGTYTFTTYSDDGVRLWVNGQLVINNWTDHSPTTNSGQITLVGGQKYDVKLELYENMVTAVIALSWLVPGQPAAALIPTSQLFSSPPASCTPICSGRQCGSDGCGGSCGTCSGGATCSAGGQCVAPPVSTDPRWFRFYIELTGEPSAFAQTIRQKLGVNGFGFWAPLSSASVNFVAGSTDAQVVYMPAANRNMPNYNYTYDPAKILSLENTLRQLTAATTDPAKIHWNGMPEWDQIGGDWPIGRPIPSSGLTLQQNYQQFRDFYLGTLGLSGTLGRPRDQRGYNFAVVSDMPWTAHWAYEWGADLVMGERIIDELSGMVPGLSYFRGAGKQSGKAWGFDFSNYRFWNATPTQFDSNDRLIGGWSPSWFKRHMYLAYMGGANVLHMEPAVWLNASGNPNPLGAAVRDFANFALVRHPNRPPEFAPFALVVDRYSGFDPKYGQYNQQNVTWYSRIPYTAGEYMLNNVLHMAYPEHNRHGTLVPGGPQSVSEYRARLAAGEDPRPWEPMGKSRWGDVFNVLNTATGATALSKHRVAMLTTHLPVDSALRTQFQQFVSNGGVLILNAAQVGAADAALTGVALTGQTAQGTSSTWVADGTSFTEPAYTYARVTLQGATVVASNAAGDPLITRYAVGSGEVYLTTPTLLQDNNRTQILNIGRKLFDVLNDRFAPAKVQGPAVLYQLNTDGRVTTVTVVNGGGSTWSGTINYPAPAGTYRTVEWVTDATLPSSVSGGQVTVSASVPPYDVRVYALERTSL